MLGLVVLVVFVPGVVIHVNSQDPVEYIRHTGIPLLPYKGELEYYDQKLPFNWACVDISTYTYGLCPDGHKCLVSDVPIGHVPLGIDNTIPSQCPDLLNVSARWESENACGLFEGYDDETNFFMSNSSGYCGANMPIYSVPVGTGVNRTIYYIAREEDAPSNAVIVGYVWKYPHLNNSEIDEVQSEVTKLQTIIYRAITTVTPQYQLLYTMSPTEQQNYLTTGYFNQPVLGLVIQEDQLSDNIRAKCPYLRQFYMYHNGLTAFIGDYVDNYSNVPEDYEQTDSFYCAPYMGYCGAYLGLYRLMPRKLDTDFLMTSDKAEADIRFYNSSRYAQIKPSKQTVCWIWYPHRPTLSPPPTSSSPMINPDDFVFSCSSGSGSCIFLVECGSIGELEVGEDSEYSEVNQTIRDANVRLARGYWTTGPNSGVKTYSVQALKYDKLVSQGKVYKAMDLGKVLLYNATILEKCPRLLKLRIFQEEGGTQRTFIGAHTTPPPATKGQWVLENTIYCAPYYNYCGATQYLWGLQSWEKYKSILYTVDYEEVKQYSVDPNYAYSLCWIWAV